MDGARVRSSKQKNQPHKRAFIGAVAWLMASSTAQAVQGFEILTVDHVTIAQHTPTLVTVTATPFDDADLRPASITLQRLAGDRWRGQSSMHDDGTHGDAQAGDGVYTTQLTLDEPLGVLSLRATARYRGTRGMVASAPVVVAVVDPLDQVADALGLGASVAKVVEESFLARGEPPADNAAAGLLAPEQLTSDVVAGVTIADGAIHLAFGGRAVPGLAGQTLSLRAAWVPSDFAFDGKPLSFVCGPIPPVPGMTAAGEDRTTVAVSLLPAACGGADPDPLATARAQVVEALKMVGGVKQSVVEYYSARGAFPVDNPSAGVPPPEELIGNYVSSVTVADGAIHIAFGHRAAAVLAGQTLSLRPTWNDDPFTEWLDTVWVCGTLSPVAGMLVAGEDHTSVPAAYLPLECGGTTDDLIAATRAQIAEGRAMVSSVVLTIHDWYSVFGVFPADNQTMDLAPAQDNVGNYVAGVEVVDGAVHITYGNRATDAIFGHTLSLRPGANGADQVVWSCGLRPAPAGVDLATADRTSVPTAYLPGDCGGPSDDRNQVDTLLAARRQVEDALSVTGELQLAVQDRYSATETYPADNAAVGLPPAEHYDGNYVTGIAIEDGNVHVTLGHHALPELNGQVVSLMPYENPAGRLFWLCGRATPPPGALTHGVNRTTVAAFHLPAVCRD